MRSFLALSDVLCHVAATAMYWVIYQMSWWQMYWAKTPLRAWLKPPSSKPADADADAIAIAIADLPAFTVTSVFADGSHRTTQSACFCREARQGLPATATATLVRCNRDPAADKPVCVFVGDDGIDGPARFVGAERSNVQFLNLQFRVASDGEEREVRIRLSSPNHTYCVVGNVLTRDVLLHVARQHPDTSASDIAFLRAAAGRASTAYSVWCVDHTVTEHTVLLDAPTKGLLLLKDRVRTT